MASNSNTQTNILSKQQDQGDGDDNGDYLIGYLIKEDRHGFNSGSIRQQQSDKEPMMIFDNTYYPLCIFPL